MNNGVDSRPQLEGRRGSKRWKRRESDGAAWSSTLNLGELSTLDDQPQQEEDTQQQVRRRSSLTSLLSRSESISQSIAKFVEDEPLLSREPVHLTAELKDRIGEAVRASATTFITLSLLIYSGQGEIKDFMWNI